MPPLLRTAALLLAIGAGGDALAACGGTISGGGRGRERAVSISDEDCRFPVAMINGKVPFDDECTMADDGSSFSCRANGRTPLAGATYVLRHDARPVCDGDLHGPRYHCVKGCRPTTPRRLDVMPYEC